MSCRRSERKQQRHYISKAYVRQLHPTTVSYSFIFKSNRLLLTVAFLVHEENVATLGVVVLEHEIERLHLGHHHFTLLQPKHTRTRFHTNSRSLYTSNAWNKNRYNNEDR